MALNLNEKGALHLGFAVMVSLMVIAGFGIWGVFRDWRFATEHQLRLDRCVGTAALEFRDHLNSIESTNHGIDSLRSGVVAAVIGLRFELASQLRQGIVGLTLYQEARMMKWKMKQSVWLMKKCGHRSDLIYPLASLHYQRPLRDWIGEKSLNWAGEMPKVFTFEGRVWSRSASARVEREDGKWKGKWSRPMHLFGSGTF